MNKETIEDIVREMRDLADRIEASAPRQVAGKFNSGNAAPTPPQKPQVPPPRTARGTLVELGALPANCARAFCEAADALERAASLAEEILNRAARSRQSGEAQSAFGLASTVAPRLRAQAHRLSRLPRPQKQEG